MDIFRHGWLKYSVTNGSEGLNSFRKIKKHSINDILTHGNMLKLCDTLPRLCNQYYFYKCTTQQQRVRNNNNNYHKIYIEYIYNSSCYDCPPNQNLFLNCILCGYDSHPTRELLLRCKHHHGHNGNVFSIN